MEIDHTDQKKATPYILVKTIDKHDIVQQFIESRTNTNEDYQTASAFNILHEFGQSQSTQRLKNAVLSAIVENGSQFGTSERLNGQLSNRCSDTKRYNTGQGIGFEKVVGLTVTVKIQTKK